MEEDIKIEYQDGTQFNITKELEDKYKTDKLSLAADQLRFLLDWKNVILENLIARNKGLESALDNSVSKDKIKEKIEELQKQLKYIACGNDDCEKCFNSYRGSSFIYCFAYHQIKVLQELLNKGE